MESPQARFEGPRRIANLLIYASIILGIALLVQIYAIVPPWLFYLVLAGWIVYLIVGVAATFNIAVAYPISLVLATLTLAVSLPQPEHYSFGLSLASLTFTSGSILQIAVVLAVIRLMVLKRRRASLGTRT